jgi:hypothetical protein
MPWKHVAIDLAGWPLLGLALSRLGLDEGQAKDAELRALRRCLREIDRDDPSRVDPRFIQPVQPPHT